MCDAWKISAEATLKATKQVSGRKDKLDQDGMESHIEAFWYTKNYLEQTSAAQSKFYNDVLSLIIQPLLNFYKDSEKKRRKIIQQEEKYYEKMTAAKAHVKKEREECLKLWATLKGSQEEMLKDSSEKAQADADLGPSIVVDGNIPDTRKRVESGGKPSEKAVQKQKNAEKKNYKNHNPL